jgi:hypothetical protein
LVRFASSAQFRFKTISQVKEAVEMLLQAQGRSNHSSNEARLTIFENLQAEKPNTMAVTFEDRTSAAAEVWS